MSEEFDPEGTLGKTLIFHVGIKIGEGSIWEVVDVKPDGPTKVVAMKHIGMRVPEEKDDAE